MCVYTHAYRVGEGRGDRIVLTVSDHASPYIISMSHVTHMNESRHTYE